MDFNKIIHIKILSTIIYGSPTTKIICCFITAARSPHKTKIKITTPFQHIKDFLYAMAHSRKVNLGFIEPINQTHAVRFKDQLCPIFSLGKTYTLLQRIQLDPFGLNIFFQHTCPPAQNKTVIIPSHKAKAHLPPSHISVKIYFNHPLFRLPPPSLHHRF